MCQLYFWLKIKHIPCKLITFMQIQIENPIVSTPINVFFLLLLNRICVIYFDESTSNKSRNKNQMNFVFSENITYLFVSCDRMLKRWAQTDICFDVHCIQFK